MKETGAKREEKLKATFWKSMVAKGCRTERFEDTYESAWHIIGSLSDKAGMQVLAPREDVRKPQKERLAEVQHTNREPEADRIVT